MKISSADGVARSRRYPDARFQGVPLRAAGGDGEDDDQVREARMRRITRRSLLSGLDGTRVESWWRGPEAAIARLAAIRTCIEQEFPQTLIPSHVRSRDVHGPAEGTRGQMIGAASVGVRNGDTARAIAVASLVSIHRSMG